MVIHMKKRIISFLMSISIMVSVCTPVGAIDLNQDDPAVIATDEFVVYITDNRSKTLYPVNVRTDILYLDDEGLGFRVYAFTVVPIINELSGFVEFNTSLDPDHGSIVNYSESNNSPRVGIEWHDYTGNHYRSGTSITATFMGEVGAETEYLGEEVLLDGYFCRTITAEIP